MMKMVPLYQKIYDYLVDNIRSGKYDENNRLPSEKELAEQFKVSRITSKKALTLLAENGMITRMPGRGSYVSTPDSWSGEELSPLPVIPRNKKRLIGLVITNFSESYGTGLLDGIEEAAARHDLHLCLRRSYKPQQEEEVINDLLELGVSGLIVMPVHGRHYNPRILRLVLDGFPIVLLDRYMKGIDASYVGTNNIEASKAATDYLLDLGHHNIAFLSPPTSDTSTLEDRIEGFVTSFAERGVAVDKSIWLTDLSATIPGNSSKESIRKDISKIKELLVNNPHTTCVFAAEYAIALLAEEAIKELGGRIPDDYSVICFDGPASFTGNYFYTHVRQDEVTMGKNAVALLAEKLLQNVGNHVKYVPSSLIIGSSTKAVGVKTHTV
jgi:GntR family transcriptional regulator of arabinose operon